MKIETNVLGRREHILVGLSNPFLKCDFCGSSVAYWHNPDRCDCDDSFFNHPCGHAAETVSACPTWTFIEGCTCKDKVNHDKP